MEFRFRLEARAKLKVEESAVNESVDLVKADFEEQPLSAQDSAAETCTLRAISSSCSVSLCGNIGKLVSATAFADISTKSGLTLNSII